MKKCEQCHTQFAWRNIYQSMWWFYQPIKCESCGMKYKITFEGRLIDTSFTILPMLLFIYFLSPFQNSLMTFSVGLVILLAFSLLVPYFTHYKMVKKK